MQRANSLEKTLMLGQIEGKRRKGVKEDEMVDSITDSMDMNLSKLQEIVEDWGTWSAAVHGIAKSWTRLSNWTTTITRDLLLMCDSSLQLYWKAMLKRQTTRIPILVPQYWVISTSLFYKFLFPHLEMGENSYIHLKDYYENKIRLCMWSY